MIVCFGSINLDLIFPLPHLPVAGETVLGPDMRIEPGGKGGNQAVAAARDGATVIFAGAVGRDALAEDALALLRAAGVDIAPRDPRRPAPPAAPRSASTPTGRNLIASASGANLAARAGPGGGRAARPRHNPAAADGGEPARDRRADPPRPTAGAGSC